MSSNSPSPSDCIFCSIAAGTTPADIVYQDERVVFFRDINPKAPVHLLGIPIQHITSVAAISSDDVEAAGYLLHQVASVARDQNLESGGYRLIVNVGSNAGQEVSHLHVHILGGEPLGPMRCQAADAAGTRG